MKMLLPHYFFIRTKYTYISYGYSLIVKVVYVEHGRYSVDCT